jgi:P4 family phage/plasmid primase-like protien
LETQDSTPSVEQALGKLPPCARAAVEHGITDVLGDPFKSADMDPILRKHYKMLAATLIAAGVSSEDVEWAIDQGLDDTECRYSFRCVEIIAGLDEDPSKRPEWACHRLDARVKTGLAFWLKAGECGEGCPFWSDDLDAAEVTRLYDSLTYDQREILADAEVEENANLNAFAVLFGQDKYHCIADLPSSRKMNHTWFGFDRHDGCCKDAWNYLCGDLGRAIEVRKRVQTNLAPSLEAIESEEDKIELKALKATRKFRLGLVKDLTRRQNSGTIKATLEKHSWDPDLERSIVDYDQAHLINCFGTAVEWKQGVLTYRSTTRDDMVSMTTACKPDASVPTPHFTAFFNSFLNEDQELIQYVRRCIAAALTGVPRHQHVLMIRGDGGRGKSVFCRLVRELFGSYAREVSDETFMKIDPGKNRVDIAELRGIRLLLVDEVRKESKKTGEFNIKLVKTIGGAGQLIAKFNYANHQTTFPVQFLLVFFVNLLPPIPEASTGIWRKIRKIELEGKIPEDEKRFEDDLFNDFRQEYPGILAYFLEGLVDGLDGIDVPDCVLVATDDYRSAEDILADFIGIYYVDDSTSDLLLKDIYADYDEWARENKVQRKDLLEKRQLKNHLIDRGYKSHKRTNPATGRQALHHRGLRYKEDTTSQTTLEQAESR